MMNLEKYMEETFLEEMRPSNIFDESGKELKIDQNDYKNYAVIKVEKIDTEYVIEQNITVRHIG